MQTFQHLWDIQTGHFVSYFLRRSIFLLLWTCPFFCPCSRSAIKKSSARLSRCNGKSCFIGGLPVSVCPFHMRDNLHNSTHRLRISLRIIVGFHYLSIYQFIQWSQRTMNQPICFCPRILIRTLCTELN